MNTLYFSAFSYGLIVFAFFRLPDSFWEKSLAKARFFYEKWKNKKEKWPLLGEITRGEKLLLFLQEAESRVALGIKILPDQIPGFKFYTSLLEQLFENYRRMGTPIKKVLPDLRKAITADLKFEKKIQGEMIGAILQFFVIAMTTWSFVFLSTLLVDLPVSKLILFFMLALQMSGIALFFTLILRVKRKTFREMSGAFTELYLFTALMSVGVSLNDVLKRSNIYNGILMNTPKLNSFAVRTKKLIERMKETGLSPKEEMQEILDGLWHFQEEMFEKFTKKVQLLKFCILAFFFLPAYFLYLVSIFQFFMEQ